MSTSPSTSFREKGLYKLLKATFPKAETVQGLLDVPKLARNLEMSNEGLYKWFREDRLTVEGAEKLIVLANGRLKQESLLPYLFRK